MVACRQISKHFSNHVTHDVTGLLANRGYADTAYGFQFHLEQAKICGSPRSGVTLDLIKCFNNIRWRFGYAMLLHMGVPESLAKSWTLSIGHIRKENGCCKAKFV